MNVNVVNENVAGKINDDWKGDAALTNTQALQMSKIVERATTLNIPDCDELGLDLELLPDGIDFTSLLEMDSAEFAEAIRARRFN